MTVLCKEGVHGTMKPYNSLAVFPFRMAEFSDLHLLSDIPTNTRFRKRDLFPRGSVVIKALCYKRV
jgi:hypothetical protein